MFWFFFISYVVDHGYVCIRVDLIFENKFSIKNQIIINKEIKTTNQTKLNFIILLF